MEDKVMWKRVQMYIEENCHWDAQMEDRWMGDLWEVTLLDGAGSL
jgi:hypothetical protein